MASRSSNRAAVPEAKGALDKFKYEVASELGVPLSDVQRRLNFKTERICRRLYGQENDRRTGKTDVRSIGQSVKVSQAFLPDTKKGMSDKQALPFSLITKLEIGLEPTTPSLRVKCSTD